MKQGQFREDLYYRLSEIVISIPPLRKRVGDSILLAHHFKNKFCAKEGKGTLSFSQEALAAIEKNQWAGNVREIENCIKRAVIMAEDSVITPQDLGLQVENNDMELLNLKALREQEECKAVIKALARVDGNVAHAAKLLGVSRPTLYDLMNRCGLK
jgi:two-component system NtrC family response regulator